jgi:signal peptidase I
LIHRRTATALATALVAGLSAGCGGTSTTSSTRRPQTVTVRVPSGSMEPTLTTGQRVTVDLTRRTPTVGQVVMFHPPAGANPGEPVCGDPAQGLGHRRACDRPTRRESHEVFLKRVVAGPDDRISMTSAGTVIRNGTRETGYRVRPCGAGRECRFPATITIPAGEYFVLGDNRGASDDSRFWGPVRRSWVLGTVVGPH